MVIYYLLPNVHQAHFYFENENLLFVSNSNSINTKVKKKNVAKGDKLVLRNRFSSKKKGLVLFPLYDIPHNPTHNQNKYRLYHLPLKCLLAPFTHLHLNIFPCFTLSYSVCVCVCGKRGEKVLDFYSSEVICIDFFLQI